MDLAEAIKIASEAALGSPAAYQKYGERLEEAVERLSKLRPATEDEVRAAQENYADPAEGLEIDSDAFAVDVESGGVRWVQAWVMVRDEDVEEIQKGS